MCGPRDSEYWNDYENREPELESMSYDEYEHAREVEDYGSTDEEMDSGDQDD